MLMGALFTVVFECVFVTSLLKVVLRSSWEVDWNTAGCEHVTSSVTQSKARVQLWFISYNLLEF
jgi:hypothetical protein